MFYRILLGLAKDVEAKFLGLKSFDVINKILPDFCFTKLTTLLRDSCIKKSFTGLAPLQCNEYTLDKTEFLIS